MEKICKNCGFSANPADATFCGRCGTKLSVQDYKKISDGTSKIQPKRDTGFTEIVNNVQENVKSNETKKTVGRNDPCPCGSGKKYKNCHGRNVV